MGVRVLDFQEPCEFCVVRACCSKTCDEEVKFFTVEIFESFNQEFSKDIQDEFLSCRGISIMEISDGQGRKKRKNK